MKYQPGDEVEAWNWDVGEHERPWQPATIRQEPDSKHGRYRVDFDDGPQDVYLSPIDIRPRREAEAT